MQKRSFFKSPFGIAAVVCFVIAVVSPFIFVDSPASQEKRAPVRHVSSQTPKVTLTPTAVIEKNQAVQGQTTYNQEVTPTISTQTPLRPSDSEGQAAPTATTQPTSAPVVQTFQVNLSINGSSVGSVTVDQGANQCDVLSRAKDQGKISQLLMKYDNSLGTNGVYQINGTGKDNSVWWTYKVNGTAPGQGCSYIKANSGDTVEWEYKG